MICRKQNFHLSPNDTLEQAIYLFKQTGEEYIAILDDKDQTKIIGVLSQRDLLRSYNKVLIEAEDL
jgi:CBS-domain-containing membrane protein